MICSFYRKSYPHTSPAFKKGAFLLLCVLTRELRRVRALAALVLVLRPRGAGPGALEFVLHVEFQRAHLLDGEFDLVAVHERVQPAVIGAGGDDVAGLERVDRA